MSNRGLALLLSAALLPMLMPGSALAAVISSSIVLTITSPGTISFGQSVDGYANVTTNDGSTPTGTVTFYDGTQSICAIPVSQSANCPASTGTGFSVGTHMLVAVYSGDAVHTGASSSAVAVVVEPDATIVSLVSSADPSISGQSVAFTAAVSAAYATPSGTVTFMDGSTVLGAAPLNAEGVANFNTSSLSPGSHAVTASYSGDAGSSPSVSTALAQTVSPAIVPAQGGFSIAVTGPTTVDVGSLVDLTVAVTPQSGFAQPVQLSCADLPAESSCTFGERTIPAGGGTTTLRVSTIAPHDCGSTTPYFLSAG
ncbi:MAG TPA: Ig-like domain-containing protein, partial [Terracidiphilus sp.]|nr:Ig-like domain-containing protein [Terracidiphilus sp.]